MPAGRCNQPRAWNEMNSDRPMCSKAASLPADPPKKVIVVRAVNASGNPARAELQSGLQLYLRQINETKLLSAEEEKELGWSIINDNCPTAREKMHRAT